MVNSNDHSYIPVWALEAIEIKTPDPMWINNGIQEREKLYYLLSPFGVKQIEHYTKKIRLNQPDKII